MDTKEQKTIKKLARLNLDAHEGYRTAAENTNDSILSSFFDQCAIDRKEYAESLAKAGHLEAKDIDTDLEADIHRAWLDIKTAAQKYDAKAVLEECERGEKHAIHTYQEVLESHEYPQELGSYLEYQKNDIESKYEQIQRLKDQFDEIDNFRNRQTPVP